MMRRLIVLFVLSFTGLAAQAAATQDLQRFFRKVQRYSAPYEQHIVGDGKQVWGYDVELKQAAVRRMQGALGATPAILLSGKGALEGVFAIKDLGQQGKFDWVQLTPKKSDGGFEIIRIGFEQGHTRIPEMVDGSAQPTRVTPRAARENTRISADKFSFKPPAGVDVIQE